MEPHALAFDSPTPAVAERVKQLRLERPATPLRSGAEERAPGSGFGQPLARRPDPIDLVDRAAVVTSGPATHVHPSASNPSVPQALVSRDGLLWMLDRAVSKRVTVISAPAGSGKTSLLRAWTDRSTNPSRVVFVSVDRDQHEAEAFWLAVLD